MPDSTSAATWTVESAVPVTSHSNNSASRVSMGSVSSIPLQGSSYDNSGESLKNVYGVQSPPAFGYIVLVPASAGKSGDPPMKLLRPLAIALGALWLSTMAGAAPAQEAPPLKLEKGDHISIIGNTLADRMQHVGWLETLLQSRFPRHELVIRNLGFSADEISMRLRSANFGSPEQWLTFTRTDVVFAFFGYNESFGGEAGLPKFKDDLGKFVRSTLSATYNGKSAPRLVLFSPIAHENLKNPHLPDGVENNQRLELYTRAMGEVAKASGVPFVDLFHATEKLYAAGPKPLTINGIHLNEEGDKQIAFAID